MDKTKRLSDISLLTPNFLKKVKDFLDEVSKLGLRVIVFESLRTLERQEELYSQGRTKPGKKVTWTLQSNHMTGNAIDIVFLDSFNNPIWEGDYETLIKIASKYGINNLAPTELAHFEDDGTIYKKQTMKQYGNLITKGGYTYPESVYGIPVRLAITDSKTLIGLAKVKGYDPRVTKDEILIFDNTFKKGEDFMYKYLMHEFSHFIYHRYLDTKEDDKSIFNDGKSFWESLSRHIASYISTYAGTSPADDFAELIGFSHFISNKIELPSKYLFDDKVKFKYEIAIKLYSAGLKKHIKKTETN